MTVKIKNIFTIFILSQGTAAWITVITCVLRKWCNYHRGCVSGPRWLQHSRHMTVILGLVNVLTRTGRDLTARRVFFFLLLLVHLCDCVCAHNERAEESCWRLTEEWSRPTVALCTTLARGGRCSGPAWDGGNECSEPSLIENCWTLVKITQRAHAHEPKETFKH